MATMRQDRQPRQRLDPEERQQAILASALDLFASQGYSETTVDQIARQSGSSQALVFRYYLSKEQLYLAVVARWLAERRLRQEAALAALDPGVSSRDRVRAVVLTTLDDLAARRTASEPESATSLRELERSTQVDLLAGLLQQRSDHRHAIALWGFLGFLETAGTRWCRRGCPEDERWPLVEACLGALEGALGDWDA